jgi:hypothetical protein
VIDSARRLAVCLQVVIGALAMTTVSDRSGDVGDAALDRHAVEYLDLVAGLGRLSPDSVDFQIPRQGASPRLWGSSSEISVRANALAAHVLDVHAQADVSQERAKKLAAQLVAVASRADQVAGKQPTLDDELARLLGISLREVRAWESNNEKPDLLARVSRRLPGPGSLPRRLTDYQRRFLVGRGRLHNVVARSVRACRDQTRRFLTLPEGEVLTVEYVADRPWSGYSVYHGRYRSVMQVNRELPLSVGQVLNLACHEGYPGHHAYNSLREQRLLHQRGWVEGNALPLFSPEGFRAEAAASAAAAIAFTREERVRLYRDELFPLAGFDPREAEAYVEICEMVDRIASETTVVIAKYLAGQLSALDAGDVLRRDALMEHPEALLTYIDRYRGYALAYSWGRDRLLFGLSSRTSTPEDRVSLLRQLLMSES